MVQKHQVHVTFESVRDNLDIMKGNTKLLWFRDITHSNQDITYLKTKCMEHPLPIFEQNLWNLRSKSKGQMKIPQKTESATTNRWLYGNSTFIFNLVARRNLAVTIPAQIIHIRWFEHCTKAIDWPLGYSPDWFVFEEIFHFKPRNWIQENLFHTQSVIKIAQLSKHVNWKLLLLMKKVWNVLLTDLFAVEVPRFETKVLIHLIAFY